jgi:hypothetical protein
MIQLNQIYDYSGILDSLAPLNSLTLSQEHLSLTLNQILVFLQPFSKKIASNLSCLEDLEPNNPHWEQTQLKITSKFLKLIRKYLSKYQGLVFDYQRS